MRIAVIGTGIAGMAAAYRLAADHDLVVYEANDYVGGHTNTVDVDDGDQSLAIDTGFIVYNERTYPAFTTLLQQLSVETQPSEMSFGLRDDGSGLEYCGSSLQGLFAQRRNLVRPRFYRMLIDIASFNKQASVFSAQNDNTLTLGAYLESGGWGRDFTDNYLLPMGAAIWSMPPADMLAFPALYFLRFFNNHGLLQLSDRPQWRVISNGSREYARKLTAGYADRLRLNTSVRQVRRAGDLIQVTTDHDTQSYDAVVMATHSDQALQLLDRPTESEKQVLGAMRYQSNEAVLHTDTGVLPRRKGAWAAWNYHSAASRQDCATLTYNMNILQRLQARQTYLVTLNNSGAVDPAKVIARFEYDHPVYTIDAVRAQQRYDEINGADRIYYCGAYWRYGFHEDGLQSAWRACEQLETDIADEKLYLRRVG